MVKIDKSSPNNKWQRISKDVIYMNKRGSSVSNDQQQSNKMDILQKWDKTALNL